MTDLSPEARALLDAASGADDPTEADQAQVDAALVRRLGAAAVGGAVGLSAGHAAGAGAAGAAATSVIGTGHVVVAVVAGLSLGLGAYLVADVGGSPAESGEQPAPPAHTVHVPSPTVAAAPATAPPAPDPVQPPAPAEARPELPSRPATSAPNAAANGAQPDLVAETRALAEVQRSLRDGDARRALALLDRQQRKLSGGELDEERAAARVFALCQAGRVAEARAAAARFGARWPKSPLAKRVHETCRD